MDDRELLELAAKATGAEWVERGYWILPRADEVWHEWDPLNDDGDALRLAVKLSLIPGYMRHSDMHMTIYEGDAKLAETRRAIVRAAAEIGRSTLAAPQGHAG